MSGNGLLEYFAAEKQGAALIGVLGVASVGFAAYLWRTGDAWRAMAWPLVVIGVGQIAIGMGLWLRTDPQVARLQGGLQSTPQVTVEAESARMDRVKRSFRIVMAVEVLLLITGLCLALLLRSRHPNWAAVGMGLVVQAAALLVFDLFAERRAHDYTRWLSEFVRSIGGG